MCCRKTYLIALFAAVPFSTAPFAADLNPPNIVFIRIDDMGWRVVGFAGNMFIEKNNLANQNPAKLKELQKVFSDWQATTNVPQPSETNPTYGSAAAASILRGGGK